MVCVTVCLSLYIVTVTTASPAKTTEPIDMPFVSRLAWDQDGIHIGASVPPE